MNSEATRVCPYCAEPVKTAAKVCPRCRNWLSVYSLRNPAVLIAILCLWCFATTAGLLISIERLIHSGMDFTPYRGSISVLESRMNFGTEDNEPAVYVVAVVTNKSDIAWRDIELDARFFDKTGTLIDAQTDSDYSTIWPHGDSAFRIKLKPSHDLSDYQSYKVFVRSARDAHSRF